MRNRFWFGMMISVSTYFCSSSMPAFGDPHPVHALEVEGLGHHADGQDALLAGDPGDHRRRAGAGAAAHAGGDEHHVRALQLARAMSSHRFLGGRAGRHRAARPRRARGHADAELDLAAAPVDCASAWASVLATMKSHPIQVRSGSCC